MSAVFNSSLRMAQKNHRCIWCGEQIPKGSKYLRETGEFQGEFFAQKWHPECELDSQNRAQDNGDGSWTEFDPYENERPESAEVSK